MVAHSAGAMAALLALDSGDVRPQAMALVAPAASVDSMARYFADAVGVGSASLAVMLERAERRVGLPAAELELVAIAARQRSLPRLLVVHDRDDRESLLADSVGLTTAWHDARLMVTDGLGHRRVLRDPDVVRRVATLGAAAAERVRPRAR